MRVLSPLQKEVLLNKEILAVHQDPSPVPGGVVSRPLAPLHSEVWLRRLASGDAAVALGVPRPRVPERGVPRRGRTWLYSV